MKKHSFFLIYFIFIMGVIAGQNKISPSDYKKYLKDLKSDSEKIRNASLGKILASNYAPQFTSKMISMLSKDPSPEVRKKIVTQLAKTSDEKKYKQIYAILMRALKKDADEDVRILITKHIGKFSGKNALKSLMQVSTQDKSEKVRVAAISASKPYVAKDKTAAKRIISSWKKQKSTKVKLGLVDLGEAAKGNGLQALLYGLKDDKVVIKNATIRSLAKLGKQSSMVISVLRSKLKKEKDPEVKKIIVEGIGNIGKKASPAIPDLLKILKNPKSKSEYKFYAIEALGKIRNPAGSVINALVNEMISQESLLRESACQALGRIGKKTIGSIIKHQKSEKIHARLGAASALGYLGEAGLPYLLRGFKNEESESVKKVYIRSFGRVGPKATKAVPTLKKRLQSEKQWQTQREIVIALGKIGPNALPAVKPMMEMMKGKNKQLRMAAQDSLPKLGKDAVPHIAKLLQEEKSDFRHLGAVVLSDADISKHSIPYVTGLLKDKKRYVRAGAAKTLGLIGKPASSATDQLVLALKDKETQVRFEAANALSKFGAVIVPKLMPLLKSDDRLVQLYAVRSIMNLGSSLKDAVPALTLMLKSDSSDVRISASKALSSVGPSAFPAIKDIISAFADPEVKVQEYSRNAISSIGEKALPHLSQSLKSKDLEIKRQTLITLGQMKKVPKKFAKRVVPYLKHDSEEVRSSATETLGKIGAEQSKMSIPKIVARLEDKSAKVRASAAIALGYVGPKAKDQRKKLFKIMQKDEEEVRVNAAKALGMIASDQSSMVGTLLGFLKKEESWKVRVEIYDVFRKMGKHAKAKLPEIAKVFQKEKNHYVIPAGAKALQQIDTKKKFIVRTLVSKIKKQKSWRVQKPIVEILGNLEEEAEDSIPALLGALSHKDKRVRSATVNALTKIDKDGKKSLPSLIDSLKSENELSVKLSVVNSLKRLGEEARMAIPALMDARNEDEYMRKEVDKILGMIRGKK